MQGCMVELPGRVWEIVPKQLLTSHIGVGFLKYYHFVPAAGLATPTTCRLPLLPQDLPLFDTDLLVAQRVGAFATPAALIEKIAFFFASSTSELLFSPL